jgi:hypothetical protein
MEGGNVAKRARKDTKKAGHERRVHEEVDLLTCFFLLL